MIDAKVTGIPDLRAALKGIVPKLRVRALRNALAAGARLVRDEARRNAPVINASSLPVRKGYRKPGTLRKAISVRTSKVARRAGDVGVFVNVRPAKSGARGAKAPGDPFYWRFLEFGWNPAGSATRGKGAQGVKFRRGINKFYPGLVSKVGARFLQRGAERLPAALQAFIKAIGPQIAKLNKPKAPAP